MISMTLNPRKPTRAMLLLTAMLVMTVPHLFAADRSNITFTGTDSVSAAIFELHNALKVDSVTDQQHHPLSGERGPNATISVALPSPMSKGATATLTFVYGGTLSG